LKTYFFTKLLFILFAILSLPAATAAEGLLTGTELEKVVPRIVRVGFSNKILSDIDPRDASAAMELWTNELSRAMGVKTVPQTIIYKDTADLLAALKKGELSIVSLTALEYLKMHNETGLIPAVIAPNNTGRARDFLLIARRDDSIRSIADLNRKTISLPSAKKQEIAHIWLDVLLMREGKRDRTSFFRQVKESGSPSQAIMALFFGQSDAAIISRGALETAVTLNPQIGKRLVVLSESKSLIGDFTCIPTVVNEKFRQSIEYAALHLHEKIEGRQILTLFHIDRVVPFQPSNLEGTVELLKERDRLLAKLGKRR
jgi:ABC-type phosphate/phosphonate transport system substrate-binding protein